MTKIIFIIGVLTTFPLKWYILLFFMRNANSLFQLKSKNGENLDDDGI